MKQIIIVIPARYSSKRFPGKPLVNILGLPMVVRVASIAKKVKGIKTVIVATDSEKRQISMLTFKVMNLWFRQMT